MAGDPNNPYGDLSFLEPHDPERDKQREVLGDLSFLEFIPELRPLSASEQAKAIEDQRTTGKPIERNSAHDLYATPYPQRPEGFYNTLRDMVTGGARQTNATRNLRSIGEVGIGPFFDDEASWGGANTTVAFMTSYRPDEQVAILSKRYPELGVRSDEAGNIILNYKGREALLNQPGFSRDDALRLGGTAAAFTPASKARQGAGVLYNMGKVGLQSLGTQAALEGQQSLAGGQFNVGDVALTGATAGGAQGLVQKLAQVLPMVFRRSPKINDSLRGQFKKYAIELGHNPDEVTDDIIREVLAVRAGGSASENVGAALEREFGVRMTKGQRSLDEPQIRLEDEMRQGARGKTAETTMTEFEKRQYKEVQDAADRVAGQYGGIDNTGGALRQGVQAAEKAAYEGVQASYDLVGEQATLRPDGMVRMIRSIRSSIRRNPEIDVTMPQTAKILDSMDQASKVFRKAESVGTLKPIHVKRLEQYRQRINAAMNATGDNMSDARQVRIIRDLWDEQIASAVDNGLFSGDLEAVANLKEARALFADYASKFRVNPVRGRSGRVVDPDPAGLFIERMVSANPTDEQIVNQLFGANKINSQVGVAMLDKYRAILGSGSDEMMAIKRAAVLRLFQYGDQGNANVLSGAKTQTALRDAMKKSGTLMRALFNEDEIDQLFRFAAMLSRTQPKVKPSNQNPSGSAMTLLRKMVPWMSGDLTMALVSEGAQRAAGGRGASAARESIRPLSRFASGNAPAVAVLQAASQGERGRAYDWLNEARKGLLPTAGEPPR